MAKSKFAHARYLLINRELRKRNWVTTADLKNKIESELEFKISIRQIEKDLEAMKSDSFLGYNAPIKHDKKQRAYQYTNREFTIEKFNLGDEEILALKFYAASLNQYRDLGVFKDFSNALRKVVEAVTIKSLITGGTDSRLVVQTDNNNDVRGVEHLSEIANAIDKRKKIVFTYKKFEDDEAKERKLAPYLLKENKNRWYIVGKLEGSDNITTFALDRTSNLVVVEDCFNLDPSFDAIQYFKYSFGISAPSDPTRKIILLFNPQEANYVKTLRIHPSQKTISDTPKNGLKISINVKPCYELYEYILGKGDAVKVISPKFIADQIALRHSDSVKLYRGKK